MADPYTVGMTLDLEINAPLSSELSAEELDVLISINQEYLLGFQDICNGLSNSPVMEIVNECFIEIN